MATAFRSLVQLSFAPATTAGAKKQSKHLAKRSPDAMIGLLPLQLCGSVRLGAPGAARLRTLPAALPRSENLRPGLAFRYRALRWELAGRTFAELKQRMAEECEQDRANLDPKPANKAARESLVRQIEAEAETLGGWFGRWRIDTRVLEAIARVPREEFVPPNVEPCAYANIPLPIGHGQTISQPFIVAVMTDLLRTSRDHVVLEVGTGSGYQAAVLAQLVNRVYSIEVIKELAQEGRSRLERLGYRNVEVRHSDGYHGWREHAPFDGIIVTAAARFITPPLVQQLKNGGRMVIPVGSEWRGQELMLVEKDDAGKVATRAVLPVVFVPLTRPAVDCDDSDESAPHPRRADPVGT